MRNDATLDCYCMNQMCQNLNFFEAVNTLANLRARFLENQCAFKSTRFPFVELRPRTRQISKDQNVSMLTEYCEFDGVLIEAVK